MQYPSQATTTDKTKSSRNARLEALLDEALCGTFPASDPVALSLDEFSPPERVLKKEGG